MPLCLIQSLPGTIYRLNSTLSLALPDETKEAPYSVPFSYRKEAREGRCSWHSSSVATEEPLCIDDLSAMCARWRERGIFSFIEVRGSLQGSEEEIQRLARLVDWLVVDATSLGAEAWSPLSAQLRELTRKVGLRVRADEEGLRPWVAQLALQLGEPGFIFVEGTGMAAVRGVQDLITRHPLSKGSARIMPLIRASAHGGMELLDLPLLDELVIESGRSCFGGAAIEGSGGQPFFGRSIWQMAVDMIAERCSAASVCSFDGISFRYGQELIQSV